MVQRIKISDYLHLKERNEGETIYFPLIGSKAHCAVTLIVHPMGRQTFHEFNMDLEGHRQQKHFFHCVY